MYYYIPGTYSMYTTCMYMYDCTHTYVVYIQLYMLLASTQCSPVAQVLIPVDHTLDRKHSLRQSM